MLAGWPLTGQGGGPGSPAEQGRGPGGPTEQAGGLGGPAEQGGGPGDPCVSISQEEDCVFCHRCEVAQNSSGL